MTEFVADEFNSRAVHGMTGLNTMLARILMQEVVHVGYHGSLAGHVIFGALDSARYAVVESTRALVQQPFVVAKCMMSCVDELVAAVGGRWVGRQPLHVVVDPVDR